MTDPTPPNEDCPVSHSDSLTTYEDVGDFLIYLTADPALAGQTEHSPAVVNLTIHFPKGTFRQANGLEARSYAEVNLSPAYARLLARRLLALTEDAGDQ